MATKYTKTAVTCIVKDLEDGGYFELDGVFYQKTGEGVMCDMCTYFYFANNVETGKRSPFVSYKEVTIAEKGAD